MFEFTESITIAASPERVWDVVSDIERWWRDSNPEHESLERLDDRAIETGARIRIREKIAGIPGVATGTITRVEAGSAVTWEAPGARYRWHGVPLSVDEGVTWAIQPRDGGSATELSAHVWARFPSGVIGRVAEWVFVALLRGVEKDRRHARTELQYLKQLIETPGRPADD